MLYHKKLRKTKQNKPLSANWKEGYVTKKEQDNMELQKNVTKHKSLKLATAFFKSNKLIDMFKIKRFSIPSAHLRLQHSNNQQGMIKVFNSYFEFSFSNKKLY